MTHALHVKTSIEQFHHRFRHPPKQVIRVPGRVNLIGEHTDYSLLPVLPIAIDREVVIAIAPTDEPVLEAHSIDFTPDATVDRRSISEMRPEAWHQYLVAALRYLTDVAPSKGAQVVVGGNLPTIGGLSSSTALTMGMIAALNIAWNAGLSRKEIVERDVHAEREVGVESGAMDQIVIAFARRGHALRIDFAPPGRRHVRIPDDLRFIVASSGTPAPKSSAMRSLYNERVIGCRMAATIVAHAAGVESSDTAVLADVMKHNDIGTRIALLPENLTAWEVARRTGRDIEGLVHLTTGAFDPAKLVPLRRFANHVITETARVDAVVTDLVNGSCNRLGANLDDSQTSLREDFGCSTDALDRLCSTMRRAGAFGARLTGAGFGGYALAAAPEDSVQEVINAAVAETGGPAFEVRSSEGFSVL